MSQKPANGQKFGKRKVRFDAREWDEELIDCRTDLEIDKRSRQGAISSQRCTIEVNFTNRDQAIIVFLHELMHQALPTVEEEAIEMGDSRLKESLEAHGVDLSPLLKGFK